MTISITHPFVSLKGDGGDATLVKPSHWNAAHSTSMATGKLLGRLTGGVGAFEEITFTAYMATILAATDKDALAQLLGLFETGDVKYTFKTSATAGWVHVAIGGSIGNAASSATILASADCLNLFVLIYTACADGIAPVSGGRTGNATNDFNAGKRLTIPQLVGRAPIGAGAAATGTSARTLGTVVGVESFNLAANQIPAGVPSSNGAQSISVTVNTASSRQLAAAPVGDAASWAAVPGSGSLIVPATALSGQWSGITSLSGSTNNSISVVSTNAGQVAVAAMQPSIPLNVMVKL